MTGGGIPAFEKIVGHILARKARKSLKSMLMALKKIKKNKEKNLSLDHDKLNDDLKNLIAEIAGVPISAIKYSMDLQKELEIDSFNATEILVAIEQKYGIKIEQVEAFGVRTFRDVLNLAKKYLQKK